MKAGLVCRCPERKEPFSGRKDRPGRLWRVLTRLCGYSAYNGYRRLPSRYSGVICLRCGAEWRAKAAYVAKLLDITAKECSIKVWYKGHGEAMKKLGREL